MNTPNKSSSLHQRRMVVPGSADKENTSYMLLKSPGCGFPSPAKISDENGMLPPDFQSLLSGDIVNDQVSCRSPASTEFRFPVHSNFKSNVERHGTPSRICNPFSSSVNCRTPKALSHEGILPLTPHDTNTNKRLAEHALLEEDSPLIKRNKLIDNASDFKSALKDKNTYAISPIVRAKSTLYDYGFSPVVPSRSKLLRSYSDAGDVKTAVDRSNLDPNLIGDYSRPCVLPFLHGKHVDLKSISCDTLAKLINGEFSNAIKSFTIIDCRYPYEYEGGHIRGAKNIYTEEEIKKQFVDIKKTSSNLDSKHGVLIFHCEFSSERGPKLCRFLRRQDRQNNLYPDLHYPETYLLHGGYKAFFEKYRSLCEPCNYLPMVHPDHEEDLRHFRSKSKTWSAGQPSGSRGSLKSSFRRLGFS